MPVFAALLFSLASASLAVGIPFPDSTEYDLKTWPEGAYVPGASAADSASLAALAAYIDLPSTGFAGWDDSGGAYTVTRVETLPQLHGLKAPGGRQTQLTRFSRRVDGMFINPRPERRNFLFTEDVGGNEQYRLGLFDLKTGRHRDMGCPPGRVTELLWGESGTRFVYGHTPEGSGRWDVRLGTVEGRDTLLLSRPGTWIPQDWSPDEGKLLVQKYVSASESELYVLSLTDGRFTRLLPEEGPQYFDHAHWVRLPGEKETRAIAFTSDRDGEFHRLYLYRPGQILGRAGERGVALPLSPRAAWDVEWVSVSRDRGTLVYSLNHEGMSRLHLVDPGRGKSRPLRGIPKGIVGGVFFREGGEEFAFTLSSPVFPGDVFTYRLKAGKAVRWTSPRKESLPSASFCEPELVRFPTFDSLPQGGGLRPRLVPAWLYLPPPAGTRRPLPVLVQIHGGPELQARPGFDAFVQYAAGRLGLAVLRPNVRGSTGYGKSYQRADDGYSRMHSVRDIGALLDWIKTRPDLDPERVAVAGRSYGGFMALSALIYYGDRLKAGVSAVGITHFPTFLKNTSAYRRDLRRVEYGDERDPAMAAFLDSISPLSALDRLRGPLLLCHGKNDPRVPYEESVRIFEALKARRTPVWFLTFREEGHALRGQSSQLLNDKITGDFLIRHLGSKP